MLVVETMGEWDLVVRKDNGRREEGGKNNGFRRSRMPIVFLCLCESGRTIARGGAQKQNNTSGEFYSSGQETDAQIGSAEGHEPCFVRFTWDSLSLSPPKMDASRDHGPIRRRDMLLSHIWRGNAAVLLSVPRVDIISRTHAQQALASADLLLHRRPRRPPHRTTVNQSAFPSHRDKIIHVCNFQTPKTAAVWFPSPFPIWKARPGRSSHKFTPWPGQLICQCYCCPMRFPHLMMIPSDALCQWAHTACIFIAHASGRACTAQRAPRAR